jgi:DNA modification methylase
MELILGDCLEELKKIEDGSIDCVITSPPYDNLRIYRDTLEWGEHIWKPVIKELFRVVKEGGVVVWVVGDATIRGSETGTSFKQTLWAKECGFNLYDTMIWHKTNPMPYIKQTVYTPSFEYMFVWSKGVPETTNMIRVPCKYAGKILKTYTSNPESIRKANKSKATLPTKVMSNVWDITLAGTNYGHPAIFPEEIVKRHIQTWSNKGEIILDCFMGSGTTGVVCKKLDRDFIGIELVEEYYNLAKERIENTPNSLFI